MGETFPSFAGQSAIHAIASGHWGIHRCPHTEERIKAYARYSFSSLGGRINECCGRKQQDLRLDLLDITRGRELVN